MELSFLIRFSTSLLSVVFASGTKETRIVALLVRLTSPHISYDSRYILVMSICMTKIQKCVDRRCIGESILYGYDMP